MKRVRVREREAHLPARPADVPGPWLRGSGKSWRNILDGCFCGGPSTRSKQIKKKSQENKRRISETNIYLTGINTPSVVLLKLKRVVYASGQTLGLEQGVCMGPGLPCWLTLWSDPGMV